MALEDQAPIDNAPAPITEAGAFETAYSGIVGNNGDVIIPKVEEAPITEPPKSFYDRAREFVPDVENEDALLERFKTYHDQLPALQTKVQELEGSKVEYPTQAAEELALFQQSLIAEGVTDRADFYRRSMEFIEENSMEYAKMAEENPAALIERGIRASNKHLSAEEIAYLVKKENATMPVAPNEADFYNDPEGLAAAKAEYNDRLYDLRIRAKTLLPKLEESRKKLDFQPTAVETPEQQKTRVDAWVAGYREKFRKGVESFDGIEVAGTKIAAKLDEQLMPFVHEAVNNPLSFVAGLIHDENGDYDPVKIARLAAMPHIVKAEIDRAYKRGVDSATRQTERELGNTSLPSNSGGSGANADQNGPITTFEEFEKRYAGIVRQ